MLKKDITYDNLDGEKVTETFYFHLNKADLAKMELEAGGMEAKLKKIIDSKNGKSIIEAFEDIIRRSYGQRSEDGKNFIRTPEITEKFMSSEAYSALFMELLTDATKGAEFVRALVPQDLVKQLPKEITLADLPTEPQDTRPMWMREGRPPTVQELTSMSNEELIASAQLLRDAGKLP